MALDLLLESESHIFCKTTAIMGTILVSLLIFHRIMKPTGNIVRFVKSCIIIFAYSFAAGVVYSYILTGVDRNRCVQTIVSLLLQNFDIEAALRRDYQTFTYNISRLFRTPPEIEQMTCSHRWEKPLSCVAMLIISVCIFKYKYPFNTFTPNVIAILTIGIFDYNLIISSYISTLFANEIKHRSRARSSDSYQLQLFGLICCKFLQMCRIIELLGHDSALPSSFRSLTHFVQS